MFQHAARQRTDASETTYIKVAQILTQMQTRKVEQYVFGCLHMFKFSYASEILEADRRDGSGLKAYNKQPLSESN